MWFVIWILSVGTVFCSIKHYIVQRKSNHCLYNQSDDVNSVFNLNFKQKETRDKKKIFDKV